jgi:hypothetical protein
LRRSDFFDSWLKYWQSQAGELGHYWAIYGGLKALVRSPYLHISIFLTLICLPFWAKDSYASDIALSAVPNLLGFTVGALAIVLAFSSADIFKTLAEEGDPKSFFMKLTANLIHFILIQVCALIIGTLAKITGVWWLDKITLFFLFYAVLSTFAAGVQLFLTAIIYNSYASLPKAEKKDDQQD